jgi:hypothetical protein
MATARDRASTWLGVVGLVMMNWPDLLWWHDGELLRWDDGERLRLGDNNGHRVVGRKKNSSALISL